jgi:hypothetical protein
MQQYLVCRKCGTGYKESKVFRKVDFSFFDGAPCRNCDGIMVATSKGFYNASKKYRRPSDVIRALCPYKTSRCQQKECDGCSEIKPKRFTCQACGLPTSGKQYCNSICRATFEL